MKLFYVPGVCSLSPHILLREMGADFQLDKVDRKTKISESGADYNALNPKGYVPGLQLDDGTLLTEGVAIAQFLADQKGGERIAPRAGTPQRYKMNEWLVFIATEALPQDGRPGLSRDAAEAARLLGAGAFPARLPPRR